MAKYTWCYDKHGNAVKVSPPVNCDMKEINESKTHTGQIGSDVGFPDMKKKKDANSR